MPSIPGPNPPGRRQQKPVTAQYLENAALYYLQRFASSSANLRRVLMGKVERSARAHGTDRAEGAALVEALIERYQRSGLLDDKAYAEAKAASLHRRGTSTRAIREKLSLKGVGGDEIAAALESVDEETPGDTELAAAVALARRRRLGPFRRTGREEHREKDMAALGRAGFGYQIARKVVDAEDPEAIRTEE
ncbi:RecX family transcriptional regulator [Skermanella sp. TT6]|uniref:Regulatory protein RecX n=1 Tax=Skermanella cutis TaxID=2775420 RepID=A0ABX7B3C3_9PROT|nr:RecX family transcriptional regulator [Skermanella sp. TT6]QQP88639.1 RecX family transcriptional regulator [Skermanella sp. TT6]